MACPPGLDEEADPRYSRDELWALRRFLLDGDGGPMRSLTLEAVPADEAAASRRPQRQERKQKTIGPITECVPVESDILKAKRDELRWIEKATGCLISEKAGLRNHTVIIQGTMSIVEKALPMVEAAFSGEAEAAPAAHRAVEPPPEPPPEPPSSAAAAHVALPMATLPSSTAPPPPEPPPLLAKASTAPPRPTPSAPELPPAEDNLDEEWEIPAYWGANAQATHSSAFEQEQPPQDLPWWHASPGPDDDDGGFWEQEGDTTSAQPASSSSFIAAPSHQQPSSDAERQQDQEDRSWWNAVTSDEFATNRDSGSAAQEEAPRAPESRMAGRWRQNRAPPPAQAAPAPPPPATAVSVSSDGSDRDNCASMSMRDSEAEAAAPPPPPPAASKPPPPVAVRNPPVAPSIKEPPAPPCVKEPPPPVRETEAPTSVKEPPPVVREPPPAVREPPTPVSVKESAPRPFVKEPPAPPSKAQAKAAAESDIARREKSNGQDVQSTASLAELPNSRNAKEQKPAVQPVAKKAPLAKVKAAPAPKAKAPEKKLNAAAPPAKNPPPVPREQGVAVADEDQDVGKSDRVGGTDSDDGAIWDEDPISTWYKSAPSQPHSQSRPPCASEVPDPASSRPSTGVRPEQSQQKVVAKPPPPILSQASPEPTVEQAPTVTDNVFDDSDLEEDGPGDKSKRKKKKKKKKKGDVVEELAEPPKAAATKAPAKAATKTASAKAKASKISSSSLEQHSHKTAFMGLVEDDSDSDDQDEAPIQETPPPKSVSSHAVAAKGAPAPKAAKVASAVLAEAPKAKVAQPAPTVASAKPAAVAKSPPPAVTAKPPPPLAEASAAKASRPAPPPPPQPSSASVSVQSAWSGTRVAPAQPRPAYEEDARVAARLQMEVDDNLQVVGPHALRQEPNQDARVQAPTAARGVVPNAKATARKEVSFATTPAAKSPKAKPAPKVKALNPLPQRNNRAVVPAPVMYSHGMVISADSENAASSRKWAERPVEKLVPVRRQEEEDDPELACYLWDRNAQKPLRDQARRAAAPVQAPPVYAKSSPAPNPAKQRHLLTKVCEMGFDEHSAKRALMQTGWAGVEEALGLLLG